MAVNPCCMPLQKGVKVMAIIDIVFDIAELVVYILALVAVATDSKVYNDNEEEITIAVAVFLIIFAILGLMLSIRLYFGAKNRDIRNCRIWLIVKFILFLLKLFSLITNGVAGEGPAYSWIVTVVFLIYRIYMMYCVYCFIQEMTMDQQRLGFQARLEGGVAYSMQTYPQQQQHQPPVFIQTGVGNPPPYTYPQGQTNTGIYNQNNQFQTTNNL